MSEAASEQSRVRRRLSTAIAMLLFSSHRLPGVRGYELRRRLGKNYPKVIETLTHKLETLGLKVKILFEPGSDGSSPEDLDRARYFIILSEPLSLSDVVAAGWRVDELAVLSATLALLFSRGGKAPLKDVMEVLEAKLPKWRAEASLERFIRRGYLFKDEDGVLHVGWRAVAEVGQRELIKAVSEIGVQKPTETTGTSSGDSSSPPQQ
ncbi:MAG: hypothetical protein QW815_05890 [Nitrososphaerota archaeon]